MLHRAAQRHIYFTLHVTILQQMLQPAPVKLWHRPGVGLAPSRLQCLPHKADARAKPPQALGSGRAMSSAVYCDDTQSLAQAIAATKEAGSCVLDCEGHDLGDKKGQLTIIQIIPYKQPSVSYIIDVLALQPLPGALQPLKHLLSDASITKILYDCRNDSGALWHEQQCKLKVRLHLARHCDMCAHIVPRVPAWKAHMPQYTQHGS